MAAVILISLLFAVTVLAALGRLPKPVEDLARKIDAFWRHLRSLPWRITSDHADHTGRRRVPDHGQES